MTIAHLAHARPLPQASSARLKQALHQGLSAYCARRLTPGCGALPTPVELERDREWQLRETAFVEVERANVADRAAQAPSDPARFVRWFEALAESGPGQNDALFPWLAEHATLEEVRWFLAQEVAGEAGFDDLVALTQVKMPASAKLELARNYWDEMGQGTATAMHGPMLERLATELTLHGTTPVVWEALALGNLLSAFAINRPYAFHSVGALGVVELTAPWRAAHVNTALRRLGIQGNARAYFALHATLDVKHSQAWNREVLPLAVREDPRRARAMAEGALMRLAAGERCFRRYRAALLPDRAA